MIKATNLDEVYNNFEGNRPLGEDEYDFFVDIYDKKLKRFIGNIKRNQNYENIFFIAGQRGNGKSSVLNNLKHKNQDFNNKYNIKHLQAKELLNYNDIDIVDVLLIIGFYIIDHNELTEQNKEILKDEFQDSLQKLADLNNEEIIQSDINTTTDNTSLNTSSQVSVGAKFLSFFNVKSTFSGTYKADENIRKEAKKIYKFKIKDLLSTINDLLLRYKTLLNSDKELLLMIDGLEKRNDIDDIFINDISILRDIQCYKVITMPVYLKETVDINDVKAIDFTMEIDDNGDIKDTHLLKEIIYNRIDDNADLITDEAVSLAVEKSAGNLRQLLNIIQTAASEAIDIFDSSIIGIDEVNSAIEVLKGQLASRTQAYSKFLDQIRNTHKITNIDDQEQLKQVLQSGLVFAYFNGRVYYDINPIIEDNIEVND